MACPSPHAELLAPAGDWDSLRAAVANGADAVYFGLANFNARHRATNFSLDELPRVMEYLHGHNVRGYVAFNTLIFSDELTEAVRSLGRIAEAGADAVIVQDLGLVALIRRLAPGLPIHASTQMTLTEPRGIEFARGLGAERAILARELTLDEIGQIAASTPMPLEVFVHGALCVAYSGQCLTSEALGGRSANRGQCAQACRLPYELVVDGEVRELGDKAYLLSPQDLAAHGLIDDLVRLGVSCLKIEGRLKSPQYVAVTTQTYRAALDAALQARPFALSDQGRRDLEQSFSRGFTNGFLGGVNHQELVQGRFPKSRGLRLGTVFAKTGRGVIVALETGLDESAIRTGDGIVFDEGHPEQDEQGGRVYEVHPASGGRKPPGHSPSPTPAHTPWPAPTSVEIVFGQGNVNLAAVSPGAIVWKTDDPQLRRRMERTWSREGVARRSPVSFAVQGRAGGELRLVLRDDAGHEATAVWPGPLQTARKHATTEADLREQLGRLGDTPFALGAIHLEIEPALMVPKSVLNDLRRKAVATLMENRAAELNRRVFPEALDELRAQVPRPPRLDRSAALYVLVRSMEQLEATIHWDPPAPLARPATVYCDFEDVRRYREAVAKARSAGLPIGVATLRILKPGEEGFLHLIARSGADLVLVRNLGSLDFLRERAAGATLIGDYSLNVANELTADLFSRAGLARIVPSYDLNWDQLRSMLGRIDPGLFEVVIHQQMPMFHMEHCVFAHVLSNGKDWRDCGRPCDRHKVDLRDRAGADLPLVADTGCRNTVFNAVPQSAAEYVSRMQVLGLVHFRIELLRETAAETRALIERYARVLAGLDDGKHVWRQLRVLNQLGVTRGTLAAR